MNADSFFTIGRTHKICQDYALAGLKHGLPYAIVSDGCSSSRDTDFGSRFLCKAAESLVYGPYDLDEKPEGYITHGAYVRSLSYIHKFDEFSPECLDATLLVARLYKGLSVKVFATGDGVVAAKRRDGVLVVKTIEYKDNAPVYLAYQFNATRQKLLHETYDCTKTITTYFIGKGQDTIKEVSTEQMEIFDFPIAEFSHVSVITDGVLSFQRIVENSTSKTFEAVKMEEEILPDLMAYKGDAGSFVQRRCQKFTKTCGENGIYHDDDFSIATISL